MRWKKWFQHVAGRDECRCHRLKIGWEIKKEAVYQQANGVGAEVDVLKSDSTVGEAAPREAKGEKSAAELDVNTG